MIIEPDLGQDNGARWAEKQATDMHTALKREAESWSNQHKWSSRAIVAMHPAPAKSVTQQRSP